MDLVKASKEKAEAEEKLKAAKAAAAKKKGGGKGKQPDFTPEPPGPPSLIVRDTRILSYYRGAFVFNDTGLRAGDLKMYLPAWPSKAKLVKPAVGAIAVDVRHLASLGAEPLINGIGAYTPLTSGSAASSSSSGGPVSGGALPLSLPSQLGRGYPYHLRAVSLVWPGLLTSRTPLEVNSTASSSSPRPSSTGATTGTKTGPASSSSSSSSSSSMSPPVTPRWEGTYRLMLLSPKEACFLAGVFWATMEKLDACAPLQGYATFTHFESDGRVYVFPAGLHSLPMPIAAYAAKWEPEERALLHQQPLTRMKDQLRHWAPVVSQMYRDQPCLAPMRMSFFYSETLGEPPGPLPRRVVGRHKGDVIAAQEGWEVLTQVHTSQAAKRSHVAALQAEHDSIFTLFQQAGYDVAHLRAVSRNSLWEPQQGMWPQRVDYGPWSGDWLGFASLHTSSPLLRQPWLERCGDLPWHVIRHPDTLEEVRRGVVEMAGATVTGTKSFPSKARSLAAAAAAPGSTDVHDSVALRFARLAERNPTPALFSRSCALLPLDAHVPVTGTYGPGGKHNYAAALKQQAALRGGAGAGTGSGAAADNNKGMPAPVTKTTTGLPVPPPKAPSSSTGRTAAGAAGSLSSSAPKATSASSSSNADDDGTDPLTSQLGGLHFGNPRRNAAAFQQQSTGPVMTGTGTTSGAPVEDEGLREGAESGTWLPLPHSAQLRHTYALLGLTEREGRGNRLCNMVRLMSLCNDPQMFPLASSIVGFQAPYRWDVELAQMIPVACGLAEMDWAVVPRLSDDEIYVTGGSSSSSSGGGKKGALTLTRDAKARLAYAWWLQCGGAGFGDGEYVPPPVDHPFCALTGVQLNVKAADVVKLVGQFRAKWLQEGGAVSTSRIDSEWRIDPAEGGDASCSSSSSVAGADAATGAMSAAEAAGVTSSSSEEAKEDADSSSDGESSSSSSSSGDSSDASDDDSSGSDDESEEEQSEEGEGEAAGSDGEEVEAAVGSRSESDDRAAKKAKKEHAAAAGGGGAAGGKAAGAKSAGKPKASSSSAAAAAASSSGLDDAALAALLAAESGAGGRPRRKAAAAAMDKLKGQSNEDAEMKRMIEAAEGRDSDDEGGAGAGGGGGRRRIAVFSSSSSSEAESGDDFVGFGSGAEGEGGEVSELYH